MYLRHLAEEWNQPDFIKQWHFRGWLCGYAIAELVMLVFSEGILTAIKGAAKAGKLSEILAKFPKVAELAQQAKTLGGDKVERLRIALKTSQPLLVARQWAGNVLRIPAEILQDLSVEAIERLKQLPRWARDRFSELNHGAMRRVLGCASPCLVNLQEVERYLKNLAADAVAGAKRLTTADEVINALPTDLLDTTKIRSVLAREKTGLMDFIKKADITDLDLAKLRDFITRDLSSNEQESKNVFTRYLNALVPSKTGPNINKFNELLLNQKGPSISSSKGQMFENFVKLYDRDFTNLQKATFKRPGYKETRTADFFNPDTGELWDCKYQPSAKLDQEKMNNYKAIIDSKMADDTGAVARSASYLFPTQEIAINNYAELKKRGFKVFFIEPSNDTIMKIELP